MSSFSHFAVEFRESGAAFWPTLREVGSRYVSSQCDFVKPQTYSLGRMRRRGKLALTQNKPNKCCVKPQRIKGVPLIVLAPFEVPLPIQVSLSLGVILIISLNV